ncbi:MAG: hypothetical protein AAF564_21070 [Bacteroidota bacterium]
MLIDKYLPAYDVQSAHQITIDAPASAVYKHICHLDMGASPIIRLLFRLRGMPADALSLEALEQLRFAKLEEIENQDLLLGIIGRFWSLDGDLQQTDPTHFLQFNTPGYARAAWRFSLNESEPGRTLLSTETRVQCTDLNSARRFKLYWRVVGPFSGLIRREMLRIIKKNAEAELETPA